MKEAKISLAQKDEAIRKLEERLQRLEVTNERSNHSNHGRRHSHRHSSRSSSNYQGHDEETEGRRHQHYEERRQNVAKPYFQFVKLPNFSGDSDPNVYLGWEAKCEQIFNVHEVKDDQKMKLASLEFIDYAMQWWRKIVMDIGLNKRPTVVSSDDLKECIHARFVPPHFRKNLLLKLQRLHQGMFSVDAYFKELETLLTQLNMHESEEAKMARFVSGLRRDIQDVVELYEYSSLEKLVHLAIKVDYQISKKNSFKKFHNDGFYHSSSTHKQKSSSTFPSNFKKESTYKSQDSKPSPSNHKSPTKTSSKKCFKYLGYGHITADCPTKRTMMIKEGEVVSEHSDKSSTSNSPSPSKVPSNNECEGDLLMIRRMLGTIPKPLDDT